MRPSSREGKIHLVKRRLFNLLAGVSLALCVVMVFIWAWSFSQPTIFSDPETGLSQVAPPHAIPLPEPSDADEYAVPLHGNFERWEYAPWEHKWYRLKENIPIPLLIVPLLIVPGIWLMKRKLRLRPPR